MSTTGTKSVPHASPRSCSPLTAARVPISGAVVPGKYSPIRGFSHFSYIEDPYHPPEQPSIHPPSTPCSVVGSDAPRPVFKTPALPPAPRNAGTFQQDRAFRYAIDPYELKEEKKLEAARKEREKKLMGSAFKAGGRAPSTDRTLRLRAPEMRTQLHRTFRHDWPCYQGLTTDGRGMITATFAADQLGNERRKDLHEYMNRVLSRHPAAVQFGIMRDSSRWGAAASGSPDRILYVFRPPWVPNDAAMSPRKMAEVSGK
ncbi:hypothetical protein AB1Y20_002215 [Prymnesium parvum]|uniref:Uncharacterized protein n=1 Tax=Prymnesium parvum TaxID=97485 RepID=A0AB34JB26_PRYPA